MYSQLGFETLKTGERMEVGVVRGPDADWRDRLTTFLGHKGDDWRPQIDWALAGPLDDLQTRFYVGHVDGRLISQIMIAGDRGVGILGHVFTLPEERRKGAIRAVMAALMEDCPRQGFRVLTLGTGFDSAAYWIYHSFGFRSVAEGSGEMLWESEPGAADAVFTPGPTSVRPVRWDDWGYFNLLAMQPVSKEEDLPRGPMLGLTALGSVEGAFLAFQNRRVREPRLQAQALVTEESATVGWALLGPNPAWAGEEGLLLDIHAHRGFVDRLPQMLGVLALLEGKPVLSYVTDAHGRRAAALREFGFGPPAELPAWLKREGRHHLFVLMRPERP
jgi:GNAT superfamily N-acetyltransferase